MNWKCFFAHEWKLTNKNLVNIYGEDKSIPYRHDTHFLWKCSRCENIKCRIEEGLFGGDEDQDDDNNDGASPEPVLSPDDYYERLTK